MLGVIVQTAMADPDVVAYLRANLPKFPSNDLRKQLAGEGVSDQDFDQALKIAQALPPLKTGARGRTGILLLAAAAALILIAGFAALRRKAPALQAPAPLDESAFIGRTGYVIHLPPGYQAVTTYKGTTKDYETVYFCKNGADPTNFLDQGLYGQLGIVRLEVQPDQLTGTLEGLSVLAERVTANAQARKEKFSTKNLQVSSLKGFEITIETPFPRVEAYVLGKKVRYTFTSGEDNQIYRDILTSLRDNQSESND